MKKTKLKKRVKALEARVEWLEAEMNKRPQTWFTYTPSAGMSSTLAFVNNRFTDPPPQRAGVA